MALVDDIKKVRGLYIRCPGCSREFRAPSAVIFDARGPLPKAAATLLDERRARLKEERDGLAARKNSVAQRHVGTKAVNLGKVVEKIATALPGFGATIADCRSLFEPIDLVVFHGLGSTGFVESIDFTEIKSGNGNLNGHQRQIRRAVQAGKVEFAVADMRRKG